MSETDAPRRVHITGPSGSGTTTLGRALATAMAVSHFDADDIYWEPTAFPFSQKRPVEARLRLFESLLGARQTYVLSGSISGWGDQLADRFDLMVLLHVPTETRLSRLSARESVRHGAAAIAPGGWRHAPVAAFLSWAAGYDNPDFAGRNRARHEAWLAERSCPVLRLDGTAPVEANVATILGALPNPA